jgi:hypothetical protein
LPSQTSRLVTDGGMCPRPRPPGQSRSLRSCVTNVGNKVAGSRAAPDQPLGAVAEGAPSLGHTACRIAVTGQARPKLGEVTALLNVRQV